MNANNEPVTDPILAEKLRNLHAYRARKYEQARVLCVRAAATMGERGGERLMLTACPCGPRCDGDAPDLAGWSLEAQMTMAAERMGAM